MNMKKIEGHEDLVKDESSGAVLNVDGNALKAYKKKRNLRKAQQEQINNLEHDVTEIKFVMNKILKVLEANNGSSS